ncbi:MAG: GNAT family N-acetyltransferase [Pseudomonadota bacterium]
MTFEIAETADLDTCFRLRHAIFVDEQGVPVEEEKDALDHEAIHLLARVDGAPVGTARVVMTGDIAKIGRVCVLPVARGSGLGAALIRAALDVARAEAKVTRARLGAQVTAIGFYEKLGFEVVGPVYLDAGIDHRDMEQPV